MYIVLYVLCYLCLTRLLLVMLNMPSLLTLWSFVNFLYSEYCESIFSGLLNLVFIWKQKNGRCKWRTWGSDHSQLLAMTSLLATVWSPPHKPLNLYLCLGKWVSPFGKFTVSEHQGVHSIRASYSWVFSKEPEEQYLKQTHKKGELNTDSVKEKQKYQYQHLWN